MCTESIGNLITSLGLLFDIGGVALLFFFGLPNRVGTGKGVDILWPGEDREEARKFRRYTTLSRSGLILLITGFGLQLLGNHM